MLLGAALRNALQAGGAPADRLEGVKPPLAGGFRSFTPRDLRSRNFYGDFVLTTGAYR